MSLELELTALHALEAARDLLDRADELLERAGGAATAAHMTEMTRSCSTRRRALRRKRAAVSKLLNEQLSGADSVDPGR